MYEYLLELCFRAEYMVFRSMDRTHNSIFAVVTEEMRDTMLGLYHILEHSMLEINNFGLDQMN
jgi:hypothetical protein